MTIRNLEHLFRPKSVAVVGASDEPGSYGAVALQNLMAGGFAGPILPVAAKQRSLFGLPAHSEVAQLPFAPDLALLCTPAAAVPDVVSQLGARGTKAVILACSRSPDSKSGRGGRPRDALFEAARPHLVRVLGPGSAGLMVPAIGLNASLAHACATPGRIAFVSQSAAVTAAVLDWALAKGIGFSCLVHLGESTDVDLGDMLDYLANDPDTDAILFHFESLAQGRKFMSAARAAARNKPLVAIRPGWVEEGSRLAATVAASLVTPDDVYAAAMRRAGVVRVFTTDGLFEAVEAVARARPTTGDRLAIVANGAGFARMAADVLGRGGGRLATFSADTALRLAPAVPEARRSNPVELAPDAPLQRYADALQVLLRGRDADAVLLIHTPTAFAPAAEVARTVCGLAKGATRNLFTCWLGGDAVQEARRIAQEAGIPSYDTPEKAVEVFLGIVQYGRNRELLMQTPPSVPAGFVPDVQRARRLVAKALKAGREWLLEDDAKALLGAYGMAVFDAPVVRSNEAAARLAEEMGFPVELKILVGDDEGRIRVGGMVRDLESAAEVRKAARSLRQRVRSQPHAGRARGFGVQPMAPRPGAHELIVGVATDPVFGPVILFGRGGSGAGVARDCAVALPPLNMPLAQDLVARTRVSRLLGGGTEQAAARREAICLALVQVSHLITDLDEVSELEINPLLADEQGVLALDARIRIAPQRRHRGFRRFAIRPYPEELEETVHWQDEILLLRPIRPEDELVHGAFLESLAAEDARYRFFSVMRHLPHSHLARFTQIDYDREMAFIAVAPGPDGAPQTLGEVRAVADADNVSAEFAIVVRSELKGKGLGRLLLNKMIAYLRSRGTRELHGETLPDNERAKKMARDCGFTVATRVEAGVVELRLTL